MAARQRKRRTKASQPDFQEPDTQKPEAEVEQAEAQVEDQNLDDADFQSDSDVEFGPVDPVQDQRITQLDEVMKAFNPKLRFKTVKQLERFLVTAQGKLKHDTKQDLKAKLKMYSRVGGELCFDPVRQQFFPYLPPSARQMVQQAKKPEKPAGSYVKVLIIVLFLVLILLGAVGVGLYAKFPELFSFTVDTGYQDYYAILGVPRDATQAEIKKTYRKLALELHPDRNPNCKTCGAKLALISEAHKCLADETRRSYYDINGRDPGPQRDTPVVKQMARMPRR
ncbi:DnaJ domain [Carpediemonas membranifera]|uniref:DnaJ domain n=1 Tax=Carpediemonas membranifera TaxID=201153 RepID=A0A8J6AQM1_9EUKA|nr:DnaJ domain [Carpediemonas membranifera]|eukprot:KAG9391606.1 DnaJ domain [Carpediemonas membranifera]